MTTCSNCVNGIVKTGDHWGICPECSPRQTGTFTNNVAKATESYYAYEKAIAHGLWKIWTLIFWVGVLLDSLPVIMVGFDYYEHPMVLVILTWIWGHGRYWKGRLRALEKLENNDE